jgi:hypothetical protein
MSVAIRITCDGVVCVGRVNESLARRRGAEVRGARVPPMVQPSSFTTVESVEVSTMPREGRRITVTTDWIDLPEGWRVLNVTVSRRYPDGLRFQCPDCQ